MKQPTDEIRRRWNAPPEIHSVTVQDDELVVLGGRVRDGLNFTISDDTKERIRLGYMCILCFEPHEQPSPKVCSLCGFGMREHQARLFATRFLGEKHIGPSVNLRDEVDRLDDELERDNWQEHPTLGIVVPG